ncbi:MAG: hypothetical protein ACLU4J_21225 [Butyricimonas paravirosa]
MRIIIIRHWLNGLKVPITKNADRRVLKDRWRTRTTCSHKNIKDYKTTYFQSFRAKG